MSTVHFTVKALASPANEAQRPVWSQRTRHVLSTCALLGPVFLFLLACFVAPLGELLRLSFTSPDGTFASYQSIAATAVYREVFVNTVVLAFNVAFISVVLSFPTAYMLTRLKGLALSLAFWCVLFPLWISVLVRTFAWLLLLGQNGPVNNALVGTGLAEQPQQFLFNSLGVYIGMVHVLLPYALLPIYSAMKNVDVRLMQASDGLGAHPLQTFTRVYLPMTAPGLAAGFLLVFLMALGFFITPALLGGMKNVTIAMLIDVFVQEQLVWPLAAAAAFWMLALVLFLVGLASRFVNVTSTVAAR
ncbi:ABC transporter permease [Variovorax ureilyticus]|uniref:ABC transporter permease n=1 Tax=Variovorax ureilyticus TaxID=1836198 RepID=A0ABU8VPP2_9BURK